MIAWSLLITAACLPKVIILAVVMEGAVTICLED